MQCENLTEEQAVALIGQKRVLPSGRVCECMSYDKRTWITSAKVVFSSEEVLLSDGVDFERWLPVGEFLRLEKE